jgi:flagellar basal-body rod protein FlgC
MGLFDGYNISASGMQAQRERLNVINSNIANANTTRGVDGKPYQRQITVFEELVESSSKNGNKSGELNSIDEFSKVKIKEVVSDNSDFIMKYEPSHPDANKDGYVAYPNVNPVIEMVNMVEATRSYQANVKAYEAVKNIDDSTLELLKV